MATVLIYSDPHLGLQRKANFTTASSDAREKEARDSLYNLLKDNPNTPSFCLGDFFDTFSNKEAVIASSIPIAEKTDLILAGNHDLANRVGVVSSLQLLEEIPNVNIIRFPLDSPSVHKTLIGNTAFFSIPHVIDQESFDAVLKEAVTLAMEENRYRVLLLHCNYNLSEEWAKSSLNLTREAAHNLLGAFHYIFIGHEHVQCEHFDGRLVLVGSWRPTAFDNIGDKRIIKYDTDNGTYESEVVWEEKSLFYSGPASKAPISPVMQYYRLEDDLGNGETQRIAVKFFDRGAFGIKIVSSYTETDKKELATEGYIESLPDLILRDLKENKPDLVPYWLELSGTL